MDEEVTNGSLRRALDLEAIVATFLRYRELGIAVFVVVFATAAAVSFLMPKQYTSSLKLLVKSERPDLVVSPDAQPAASRREVTETQVNSEIELLTTDEVLTEVVRRCHLAASSSPVDKERALRKVRKAIHIAPARKADIIDVTYSAPSPKQAAAVLQELASAYLVMHLRVHRTSGTQEFFRQQTDRYAGDLKAYETRLNDFRRINSVVSINEQKELVARKLLETESAQYQAEADWRESVSKVKNLEDQLSRQTERVITQTRTTPNQYSVERLNTMLAELQNRKSQLEMKFKDNDRTVNEVDQEIANTRAAFDRASKMAATEQTTDLNPIYTALARELYAEQLHREALNIRRTTLTAEAAEYRRRLGALETETATYNDLERGVKESEENYLLYARKQEEARIADSLDKEKVANISIAEIPVEHVLPTSPNLKVNLALGSVLALLCSIAAVFGISRAQGVLHTPSQVESEVGVPVLATFAWTEI